jgi:hypothetical protein
MGVVAQGGGGPHFAAWPLTSSTRRGALARPLPACRCPVVRRARLAATRPGAGRNEAALDQFKEDQTGTSRDHSGVQPVARDAAVIDGWLLEFAAISTSAKVYFHSETPSS